jgi:hypothetical protein
MVKFIKPTKITKKKPHCNRIISAHQQHTTEKYTDCRGKGPSIFTFCTSEGEAPGSGGFEALEEDLLVPITQAGGPDLTSILGSDREKSQSSKQ